MKLAVLLDEDETRTYNEGDRSRDQMMRNVWDYARELRRREGSEVVIVLTDGTTFEFESCHD